MEKIGIVEISMDNGDKIHAPVTYDEYVHSTSDIISMLLGKNFQSRNIITIVDTERIPRIIFVSKISSIKTFKGIILE